MTLRKWLGQYWLVIPIGASFVIWSAVSAGWFVDAAHNSSDWLRGKLVDEGLWVAAVFSVWSVTALVTARVLALFVLPGKKSELRENDWGVLTGGGFALTLLGTGVWTLIGTVDRVALFNVLVLFAVGSVIAGIVMLGLGLGQRLRLQINVIGPDGTTSAVRSAFVAARMEAMGTSRPRGLDFPHGTDVANLPETALSTAATNESKIVAALLTLFRSIAFIIPWKAEVVIVDSETAAVTLRRNGRRLDSQLVSTSLLLPDLVLPDGQKREPADVDRAVLTAAAAFLLFSLSTVYPKLKEGMSGATNWRGVAAQVLATTVPWKNDAEASMELFARAVNEDPGNMAAWLGYLVKRAGYYGTVETLEWVIAKLKTLAVVLDSDVDPGMDTEVALRIRLLRNLTVFQTNHRLLLPVDEHSKQQRLRLAEDALVSASYLVDVVDSISSPPAVAGSAPPRPPQALLEYVEKARPLAASLYLHALALVSVNQDKGKCSEEVQKRLGRAETWMPRDGRDLSSLRFHYDRACALLEEDSDDHDRALLPHLELALTLKQLRAGVESDPSLAPLRSDERFAALIDADVRIRIASLKPLTGYSEKLAADGIRFTSDLLARKDEADHFATSLNVAKKTVTWIIGICKLAEACPVRVMAVEWTNLLTEDGITDMAALRMLVRRLDGGVVSPRLARRAEIANVAAPGSIDLKRWARVITPS